MTFGARRMIARRAYDAESIKKMKTVRGPDMPGQDSLC
jgi:hypothetical protein